MNKFHKTPIVFLLLSWVGTAVAAETVTYTYDAKGRLVAVARVNGPVNNTNTTYQHDKADNRKRLTTTIIPR